MARGVDEIQLINLAVLGLVIQGDALRLDGDAAFALQIHGIQHLGLHFPVAQTAANLDEPIRQRRLTVIDMGDDREISDMFLIHLNLVI